MSVANIKKIVNVSKRDSISKWNFRISKDSEKSEKYFEIILQLFCEKSLLSVLIQQVLVNLGENLFLQSLEKFQI